jgi:hypothetical protein
MDLGVSFFHPTCLETTPGLVFHFTFSFAFPCLEWLLSPFEPLLSYLFVSFIIPALTVMLFVLF